MTPPSPEMTTMIASAKNDRLPRQRQAGRALPPFRLTVRDLAILQAVAQYRALTSPQIVALFFPTGPAARALGKINPRCQHRLQLLYHYGYLYRDEQPQKLSDGRLPFVYFLDAQGAQVLELEEGEWTPAER